MKTRSELAAILAGQGHEIVPGPLLRNHVPPTPVEVGRDENDQPIMGPPRDEDDEGYLLELVSGEFAFIHFQTRTNGLVVVVSTSLTACENAARSARYPKRLPSKVAARLGL